MEWVLIPLFAISVPVIGSVLNKWIALRVKEAEANSKNDPRIDELVQRVQVLERIVTDSKTSLKNEINSLETADS